MRKLLLIFWGMGCAVLLFAQDHFSERPKLVVGVMVDQMRMEYIYRFYDKFGNDGFKRIINSGFYLSNAQYNYVPTYTGPGHTSVYTGTTPALHGIVGNEWFDKNLKKDVYCVEDPNQKSVGHPDASAASPWRELTTTVTDELKLATQKHAKVIGISIKDRAAVLPAGHMADGAYWYDSHTGDFVTSTFYRSTLPEWVDGFNKRKLPDEYMAKGWKPLLPIAEYTESQNDASIYEGGIAGKQTAVFPYQLENGDYDKFLQTPMANDFLTEFAKAAVTGEEMGKDATTDFLCMSYSSTDMLGHAVGPEAIEVEDMYMRLDRNIADLMKWLDAHVGQGQYTLFLSADHAVADVPQYMMDSKVPAGYMNQNIKSDLNSFLAQYFQGKQLVLSVSNDQIYFDHDLFQYDPKVAGIDLLIATQLTGEYLMNLDGIADYFTKSELRQGGYGEEGVKGAVIRGYNPKRSGDVAFVLEPQWLGGSGKTGTSHGSPYKYDTHVPVLFFGWGVAHGTTAAYHPITDIAPTISVLLKIKYPSGCTGQPITELLKTEGKVSQ